MLQRLVPRYATVVFDVDSTLSALEGVDWLADRRDAETSSRVRALTRQAMSGELALERVYDERLALVRPHRDEIAELARAYIAAVEPGARLLCAELQSAGCAVVIVSGGLREAILPLATHLGVSPTAVHAVEVAYDDEERCTAAAREQPLTTAHGKPQVVHALRASMRRPLAVVGDGMTDAATRGVADAFIAYTGVVHRDAVVALADSVAPSFDALHMLLFDEG